MNGQDFETTNEKDSILLKPEVEDQVEAFEKGPMCLLGRKVLQVPIDARQTNLHLYHVRGVKVTVPPKTEYVQVVPQRLNMWFQDGQGNLTHCQLGKAIVAIVRRRLAGNTYTFSIETSLTDKNASQDWSMDVWVEVLCYGYG